MNSNKKIGDFGEQLAVNYLVKKGYTILATNEKLGYQEIDIIANIKSKLVFVEVKTRVSKIYGEANEAITTKKVSNLKKAIEKYLIINELEPQEVGLDLLAIDIDKNKKIANIKHYKDIF